MSIVRFLNDRHLPAEQRADHRLIMSLGTIAIVAGLAFGMPGARCSPRQVHSVESRIGNTSAPSLPEALDSLKNQRARGGMLNACQSARQHNSHQDPRWHTTPGGRESATRARTPHHPGQRLDEGNRPRRGGHHPVQVTFKVTSCGSTPAACPHARLVEKAWILQPRSRRRLPGSCAAPTSARRNGHVVQAIERQI